MSSGAWTPHNLRELVRVVRAKTIEFEKDHCCSFDGVVHVVCGSAVVVDDDPTLIVSLEVTRRWLVVAARSKVRKLSERLARELRPHLPSGWSFLLRIVERNDSDWVLDHRDGPQETS